MEKAYNISSIRFTSKHMFITIDNKRFKLLLTDVSEKLAKASDKERKDFKISPSGYGIHWKLLDEDLSVNGLLKLAKSNQAMHTS